MSRSQYAHTIRDLFGGALGADAATSLGVSAAARFPIDERVGPFAANATASISDAHGRAYMDAANSVAAALVAANVIERLLPCKPSGATDETCAAGFITTFGRRALRKPVDENLRASLLSVFRIGASNGGFANGTRLVIQAMLQSPDFLYHVEDQTNAASQDLEPYELAARLAYFIWDSAPDEPLLDAAAAGKLANKISLRAQAERLLMDPRARDASDRFASQWLRIENLETVARDPKLYPGFTPTVAAAMKKETLDFFDQVVRGGDGSLHTLLTATKWAVPNELLDVYKVSRPFLAPATTPLEMPATQRAGVLTQASVLTATSHMDHTSPVKRGVFLLDNVLCYEIPLPVGLQIPPLPEPDPKQTTRERFAVHTQQPACAACHTIIDPLGFALEQYNAAGTYREQEGGKAIDSSGVIAVEDPSLDGPVSGGVSLSKKLAGSKQVAACMVKQMHRFALGRQETDADVCSLQRLENKFAQANGNVRELMLQLVTDEAFYARPAAKL